MTATIEDVVGRARGDNVRLVRFLYCDPSGVIRGKTVHVERLASRMREGVGLTRAQNAISMLEQLVAVDGMAPVGEIRVVPDPDTYSVLDWLPRTASLLCDQLGHDRADWGGCPRSFLKRAIAAAGGVGGAKIRGCVTIARNSCTQGQGIAHGAVPSASERMSGSAASCHGESLRWA